MFSTVVSIYFVSPQLGHAIKANFRVSIQRYAQFWFFRKGLGLAPPPHFVFNYSRKLFLMLYSINWANFSVRWPLHLEILGNISMVFVFAMTLSLWYLYLRWRYLYGICICDDVINFDINLRSFLIQPFSYIAKKVRTKSRYLKNKKGFQNYETKSIFHHF